MNDQEKLEYWKKRMLEKLKSAYGWMKEPLRDIEDFITHIKPDEKGEIKKSLENLDNAFNEIQAKIINLK